MNRSKVIIKKIINLGGVDITRYSQSRKVFRQLFKKYQGFTMIPEEAFISNLELCNQFKNLQGDYVECGVWRGGMSSAIAEILDKGKTLHLFDSFEGLPPAKEIDGKEALAWQNDVNSSGYFNNCSAEETYAIEAMALAGCKNYKIYKGWFNQTLPNLKNHPIGILRLDGDWYDSIMDCLNNLFPQVINGGIILLDDYYAWDGCSKAVHDFLSRTKSPSRLYQWNNQIAYIIKKSE
jgi:O-methyltransferase